MRRAESWLRRQIGLGALRARDGVGYTARLLQRATKGIDG